MMDNVGVNGIDPARQGIIINPKIPIAFPPDRISITTPTPIDVNADRSPKLIDRDWIDFW